MSTKRERALALSWLTLCFIMVLTLFFLLPRVQIDSSVLSLLPKSQTIQEEGDPLPAKLEALFLDRLEQQVVFMVSASQDVEASKQAIDWFYQQLQNQPYLHHLRGPMTADEQSAWGQFAYQHRNNMLDEQTRNRLQEGTQVQWILGQVYSAFAGVGGVELENDPLLLVRGSQIAQLGQQADSKLRLEDQWLVAQDESGLRWYFIYGELKESSYSIASSRTIVTSLEELRETFIKQWPEGQVLSRGTIFYTDHASNQAQGDIKRLGSITVLGVFLLIYLVFRSIRPLLLCILSVLSGALAGTVATLLVFGSLHLMTLVLSISVIGVSTDYAIYYLSERLVQGGHESPWQSMRKMASAQWLALITTIIAYLMMAIAPFPGIQQLAVFASAGLCAAGMTVMFVFPYLVGKLSARPVPAMPWVMQWLLAWRKNRFFYIGIPALVLVLAVVGLFRLQVDDDVALLQSLPAELLQQDQAITALSGQSMEQQWFTVHGRNQQEALERLADFKQGLDEAVASGWLVCYKLLPLLSLKQQQADVALLAQTAPQILKALKEVGLELNTADINAKSVLPQMWLESPVSQGWRLLWGSLGENQPTAILVPVQQASDTGALEALAATHAGVDWVDRRATYTKVFKTYRVMLGWLLLGVVIVLVLSYMLRLGAMRGAVTALPSVLSIIGALGMLGIMGVPLNLFGLLALILVLGIGINYTIFFSNPKGTATTSMMATTVAFLTTLFTLGVLVFSHTQAISSFGLVLSSGIFIAFLTSPLALYRKK